MKWQGYENSRTGAIPIQLIEGANSTVDRVIRDRIWVLTPAAFASFASQGGSPSSSQSWGARQAKRNFAGASQLIEGHE